jgi:hypothetical protein
MSSDDSQDEKNQILKEIFKLDKKNNYHFMKCEPEMKCLHVDVITMLLYMIPAKVRPKKCHVTRKDILIYFTSQKDKTITFNLEEEEWTNQELIDACRCWGSRASVPTDSNSEVLVGEYEEKT